MDDPSSVQLGQPQAGLMGTAQQGHQLGLALPVYQPPIVHGMLHKGTLNVRSKKHQEQEALWVVCIWHAARMHVKGQ